MEQSSSDSVSPGELVRRLLAKVGWTQTVLSTVTEIDQPVLSRVIANKRAIDAVMALRLAEAFAVQPEDFLNAQTKFDLDRARATVLPDPKRSLRAHALATYPVAEMVARGWLEADLRDLEKVEEELLRFFGAESLGDVRSVPHAARRTNSSDSVTPSQHAWMIRVRQIASEMIVGRYSPSTVRNAIDKLDALLLSPTEVRHVPKILSDAGIRFVVVERLGSGKIDGVCLWLNDMSPVIGMTLRTDTIDNFWFVLRHELEHVLRGHGRKHPMLDVELDANTQGAHEVPEEEQLANSAAAHFCVPSDQMTRFINKKSPFFADRDILGFAATLNIHPGLVAGQLQHKTGRFDRFRKHQVRIRDHVLPSAIADGWGDVYPLGN